MEVPRRLLTVAFTYLVCAAPGCQPIQFEWQGPSTAFKTLDLNGDKIVTRPEWEAKYGTVISRVNASAHEFERADCERDGRLTWSEYFRSRFKGRTCDFATDWYRYVEGPTDPPGMPVGIAGGTDALDNKALFALYSESPGPESSRRLIDLRCSHSLPIEIECSLSNRMQQDTLTLIVLTITFEGTEWNNASTHAKTVWVAPRSSTRFVIRPKDPKDFKNFELNDVEIRDFRVLRR